MKIISPSAEIVLPMDGQDMLRDIEWAGRNCYKSEDRITADSAPEFVRDLIINGHESVLEHCSFSARIVCDRGVSHELVRHRLASYCVSGDTAIRSISQKTWTAKQLFEWQGDPERKGRIKLMNIRRKARYVSTRVYLVDNKGC